MSKTAVRVFFLEHEQPLLRRLTLKMGDGDTKVIMIFCRHEKKSTLQHCQNMFTSASTFVRFQTSCDNCNQMLAAVAEHNWGPKINLRCPTIVNCTKWHKSCYLLTNHKHVQDKAVEAFNSKTVVNMWSSTVVIIQQNLKRQDPRASRILPSLSQ